MNEAGNSKFNFLNSHDPYNAYYQHKIKEIQEGVAQEKAAAQQPGYVVRNYYLPYGQKHFAGHKISLFFCGTK